MTNPRDPRARRRAPAVDALAAALRLEAAAQTWQASQPTTAEPVQRPDDDPPTAFLDLAAIRAAVAAAGTDVGPVDPAAAAWLAGGPDPRAAEVIDRVDRLTPREPEVAEFGLLFREPDPQQLEPEPLDRLLEVADELAQVLEQPVEHPCEVLGNAFHSDGPCGPQHTVIPLDEPEGRKGVHPRDLGPAAVFGSEHGPGWRSRHDVRSRSFGVRGRLYGSAPLTDHLWPVGPVLDQGVDGACVGFGTVAAINAAAAGDRDLTESDAAGLYRAAQRLDAIPGEAYTGTSVLAGMQAAVAAGLIGGYLWAFGTRDVAQAVLQRGPVVIGVPWLTGLDEPGPGGLLELSGEDRGGHCLAVVGLLLRGPQNQIGPYFVLQNSYGEGWGGHGLGYIHHRDLATLLRASGEAAVPTREPQR